MTAETSRGLTERARRSFSGRLAPFAVLALGFLFVVGAAYRLDSIYARDAGIFSSSQLAPRACRLRSLRPLAGIRRAAERLREVALRREFCARAHIEAVCARKAQPHTNEAEKLALVAEGRRLFTAGAQDVSVTGWQERPGAIVVAVVSRYGSDEAARRALRASRRRVGATVPRIHVACSAWLEGRPVLVGMLVSSPTRGGAERQLRSSGRDVRAFVETSRVASYELLALGPLLLLFAALFSGRTVVIVAAGLVVVAASVVALAVALVALLTYIPIAVLQARRRGPRSPPPPFALPTVRVESVAEEEDNLASESQSVMLALVGLVAFGIAMLTTSLFPASLAWGSLLVVAFYTPNGVRSGRGRRWILRGRAFVRVLLVVTVAGLLFGLAPIGLLSDVRFQVFVVAVAMVVLIEHWRGLITETAVGYAKWYEDIDARSTLFLAGVGLLTIGAASLFLASTGDPDLRAHAGEKALGLAGLLVASTAAAHARAARDAAARERARRRATPHVLYLRSFGDDKLRVVSSRLARRGLERLSWRRTELFEDVVARSLSAIGPVVAIARPGTEQHDLGAARDSIVVDDWLTAVKSYMSEALLVAVVMGTSEGLVRELQTLGELGLLDRVCIFVPPLDDEQVAERMDVLKRQTSFSELWGGQPDNARRHGNVVALASIHGSRVVLTASKRTANAYRAVGATLQSRVRSTISNSGR